MFLDIIYSFLTQIVFTIGVIFLFGWIISLCNKQFYANFGSHCRVVTYVTGFIGTPLHELSHALFCLIFFHKIVEIKLFQISDDGTLGYVKHTYNKKKLYPLVGNFFIGIAPIIVISLVLYLVASYLISPAVTVSSSIALNITALDIGGTLASLWEFIKAFFSSIVTWQWWVFILIGIFLSLHMTLSSADIKSAISGLSVLLILLFIVDVVLGIIGSDILNNLTGLIAQLGGLLCCVFTISLFISLIALGVSFLIRLIMKKLGKN